MTRSSRVSVRLAALTVHIAVLSHGVDLLVGQDLDVLAAGPAVQLVDPDQPAAHAVRHFALLAYMLREIRRGLIGYLSEIRCHHKHQYVHVASLSCLKSFGFIWANTERSQTRFYGSVQ